AEDGIRDCHVTGVQTCALPILIISACSNSGQQATSSKKKSTLSSTKSKYYNSYTGSGNPAPNIDRTPTSGNDSNVNHLTIEAWRSEERRVGKDTSVASTRIIKK